MVALSPADRLQGRDVLWWWDHRRSAERTDARVCARCVMDESAPGIVFDERGICNYCKAFEDVHRRYVEPDQADRRRRLEALVEQVKRDGRGRRYDCVVGISGGVDSSSVLVKTIELGLRPLAVHMDNGWNAELAQNNIANLVRNLGVDLVTHVIDWSEYRGLMEAFFAADVIDVELLYDNAAIAVNFRQAHRFGVKHMLNGTNVATEGMPMPPGWNWNKFDRRNIVAISRRFGGPRLSTFPSIGTLDQVRFHLLGLRWHSLLNFFDYKKQEVMAELQRDHGYTPYPFKHYESVFTRFYQGFILPVKFGVDKRRLHHSTLVMNGEMRRDEALESLAGLAYESERLLRKDRRYFLKKMRWNEDKLDDYLARPAVPHDHYPSETRLWDFALGAYRALRGPSGRLTRTE
jgi:N-acetyl sugar amidotransferase